MNGVRGWARACRRRRTGRCSSGCTHGAPVSCSTPRVWNTPNKSVRAPEPRIKHREQPDHRPFTELLRQEKRTVHEQDRLDQRRQRLAHQMEEPQPSGLRRPLALPFLLQRGSCRPDAAFLSGRGRLHSRPKQGAVHVARKRAFLEGFEGRGAEFVFGGAVVESRELVPEPPQEQRSAPGPCLSCGCVCCRAPHLSRMLAHLPGESPRPQRANTRAQRITPASLGKRRNEGRIGGLGGCCTEPPR